MSSTDDQAADVDAAAAELAFEDGWEWCQHDCDDDCYDEWEQHVCRHQHCGNCGSCTCPGYCDDYQTYNLRPAETGGAELELGEPGQAAGS